MNSDDLRKRLADRLGPRREAENELDAGRMPLTDHLAELRKRLVYALLAVGVLTAVAWNWNEALVRFLEMPLLRALPPEARRLYFTGIADKFFVYLKVCIAVGTSVATPILLYQVWRFIAPGLYRDERRAVAPFVVLGTVAFYLGLAFAYYVVLPAGYAFLVRFGGDEEAIITLTEYFGLTLKLLLVLGFVFEVPVLILVLVRLGILDGPMLRKFRRQAFLLNAVLAAVLTPTPDAATMLLVLGPLQLLYEVSVVAAGWFTPKPSEPVS
jgi:sec-independent protein translocase protein TatC